MRFKCKLEVFSGHIFSAHLKGRTRWAYILLCCNECKMQLSSPFEGELCLSAFLSPGNVLKWRFRRLNEVGPVITLNDWQKFRNKTSNKLATLCTNVFLPKHFLIFSSLYQNKLGPSETYIQWWKLKLNYKRSRGQPSCPQAPKTIIIKNKIQISCIGILRNK
jgi:hypothetical protein